MKDKFLLIGITLTILLVLSAGLSTAQGPVPEGASPQVAVGGAVEVEDDAGRDAGTRASGMTSPARGGIHGPSMRRCSTGSRGRTARQCPSGKETANPLVRMTGSESGDV